MAEGKKLLGLVDNRLQVITSTVEKLVCKESLSHFSCAYFRSQEVEYAQTLLVEVHEKLYQLE